MAKHGIKLIILAIWLALMGWWWAESRTWPTPEKIDAAFLPEYNDFYSLSYGDQKIGWSYRSLQRLSGGGYVSSQSTTIKALLGGEELEIICSVLINTDRALNLISFTYIIQAGPLTVSETGDVADGRVSIHVNLGSYGPLLDELLAEYGHYLGDYARQLDFNRDVILDLPEGPVLSQLLPSYLSYLGLVPGRNYTFQMIDPFGRRLTPLPVRVAEEGREYDDEVGREVPTFRIISNGEAGGTTEMWVDRFGRVFRESGLGLALTREKTRGEATGHIEPLIPPASFQRLFDIEKLTGIINRAVAVPAVDDGLPDTPGEENTDD